MVETETSTSQDRDVDNFSRDETLVRLETETTTRGSWHVSAEWKLGSAAWKSNTKSVYTYLDYRATAAHVKILHNYKALIQKGSSLLNNNSSIV